MTIVRKVFRVTNGDGEEEFYETRSDAVDMVGEALAMALQFDYDGEYDDFVEYMLTHDETPYKYDHKYKIEEINVYTLN